MKSKVIPINPYLLLILFLWITYEVKFQGILSIDSFCINNIVLSGRSGWLTNIFTFLTFFAGILGTILLGTAIFCFLKKKERWYFLGSLMGAVLVGQGLKFFIQRPRPPVIYRLVEESGFSFPSGHSMIGTVLYGYLVALLWRSQCSKKTKWLGTIFLSMFIFSIGFSRIYLGVHYASDVLAGFLLGTLYLWIFFSWKEGNQMKKKSLLKSFYHAGEGIISAFFSERNMKIHVWMMILVIFSGFYFQISNMEWLICLLLFGVVISAEIMNTAVETVVDLVSPEKNPKAKLAKDLSAGAVLVVALVAAIIGFLIFFPKMI